MADNRTENGCNDRAPPPEPRAWARANSRPRTSPRIAAINIGHLFQAVGLMFMVSACGFWTFSTRLVKPADQPARRWIDYLSGDRLPAALLTICVATTLVGGLGLAAAGVGMQGEKRGGGRAAVAVSAVMAGIYGVSCVVLFVRTDSWALSLIPAAFALLGMLLLSLAAHVAAVLRRFPAPPDQSVVTDEFLEAYGERRDLRGSRDTSRGP